MVLCGATRFLSGGVEELEADAIDAVSGLAVACVEGVDFGAQGGGGRKTVEACVVVGETGERHFVDGGDFDVARAGDVTSLSGPHAAIGPEANRLGLFAGADGGEELFLEEQHEG